MVDGPIPWSKDPQLTEGFISHINDNQELQDALLADGQLRTLEEGDHSKDDYFFEIAQRMFKNHQTHQDIVSFDDSASRKEVAGLMKERWHQLVDMTATADKELEPQSKTIRDESGYEEVDDEGVKERLKKVKTTHPWYFKILNLLPSRSDDPEVVNDPPLAQEAEVIATEAQQADQQPMPSSNDDFEPVTPALMTPSAPNGRPLETAAGITIGITEATSSRSRSPQLVASPTKLEDDERGSQFDRKSVRSAQSKKQSEKRQQSDIEDTVENAAVAMSWNLPNIPDTGAVSPTTGAPIIPVSSRMQGPVTRAVNDGDSRKAPSDRQKSPAPGSSSSKPQSTGTARRIPQASKSIPVIPDELAMRLEQVAQSLPDSPVAEKPRSVEEWVQEVASTTQADPLVTMPPTDFEAM
ncbi:hypothetical protein FRB95_006427, partial [Tulasnella sp. JGI-2019a]